MSAIRRATFSICSAWAQQLGTHFLVRTRGDRLADGRPGKTIAEPSNELPAGVYRVTVRNRQGENQKRYWKSATASENSDGPGQEETLSGNDGHGDRSGGSGRCRQTGTGSTGNSSPIWPVNSRYQASGKGAIGTHCVEDRSLSQDSQIGLSGRTSSSENRSAPDKSADGVLHSELAYLLVTMTNRIAPEADPNRVFTDLELRILDRIINEQVRSS